MTPKRSSYEFDNLEQRSQADFVATNRYDIEINQNLKLLPLEEILDRPQGDTRPLHENHVKELAESIGILGLITPLTVDRNGYLLAGGHRRAALSHLKTAAPDYYLELFPEGIPVRVIDIDATEAAIEALQIEVEENTQRRNFSPNEIKNAATKLEAAGYSRLKGRPKEGEKSLKRELAKVFRLSEDRIQKILNDPGQKGRRTPTFSPDVAISTLEKWSKQLQAQPDQRFDAVQRSLSDLLAELKKLDL
jgi:ParB-like chromosome segregation protein Spo0J